MIWRRASGREAALYPRKRPVVPAQSDPSYRAKRSVIPALAAGISPITAPNPLHRLYAPPAFPHPFPPRLRRNGGWGADGEGGGRAGFCAGHGEIPAASAGMTEGARVWRKGRGDDRRRGGRRLCGVLCWPRRDTRGERGYDGRGADGEGGGRAGFCAGRGEIPAASAGMTEGERGYDGRGAGMTEGERGYGGDVCAEGEGRPR